MKEETEKKKEKEKIVEMLQNARISRMSFLKGSAPKEIGKPHHKSSENGGHSSQTCFMAASASKRAKGDDGPKKEKVQK